MIVLKKTTEKLQIVLAGAVTSNQLEVTAVYYDDIPQATTSVRRRAHKVSSTNSTTDVDIVDAPADHGIIRNIEKVTIHNKDTATATPTIKLDDGGTETIEIKQSIAAGESMVYEHGAGWQILSPITPPFEDSTELIKGSVDATKRLRIEVDGFTAGQTRVMTPPDVNFSLVGSVIGFAAGTVMLFNQTAAPTGWTKSVTHNDKALRVVSGAASSGGATAFTSVFGSGKSTSSYTLLAADIPAHTHTGTTDAQSADHTHSGTTSSDGAHTHAQNHIKSSSGLSEASYIEASGGTTGLNSGPNEGVDLNADGQHGTTRLTTDSDGAHTHTMTTGGVSAGHTHTFTSASTGGGGGHSHTLSLDLQYVDVIIATKD